MTYSEVVTATNQDPAMQKLKAAILSGKYTDWKDTEIADFKPIRYELAIADDVILRDTRLVLPVDLRSRAVDLAHDSHQGIVKTKQLLRGKVWFPGIDTMVERKVHGCLACQSASSVGTPLEPLRITKLPQSPWKEVSVDFKGPFPSGEYLLVIVDDFSRFPEVEIVSSTSARAVIPKLDAVFARQGIPDVVKTDNGPPFNGHDFKQFAEYTGFTHRKCTPLWPRANGEAERFIRTLVKTIRTTSASGLNWKQELWKFLLQYRATPHSTTGLSPSEALNGRKLKNNSTTSPLNVTKR